ncbi:hypothetical protein NL676_029712 [Syzygium grande]|nr:hypothetical protein NL676_029712 [Syzygium grande]
MFSHSLPLGISDCPELRRRCKRDGGEDWDKIAHIPDITLDPFSPLRRSLKRGEDRSRFLKQNKRTVDLVGNEKMKASTNVMHIVIPCTSSATSQVIPDIVRCYGSGGHTIIFTETKECASQLSGLLPRARPLHGDIQQAQRDRGLDINDVQLIIQCEPPRDVEAYIHRSGCTGISGVKFEHMAALQPSDAAQAAGIEASAAEQLLNTSGMSAVELPAKALAKAPDYSEKKSRSLLSSLENHVTLLLETGRPIYIPSYAFSVLRRFLPEEKVESVKGLTLTADGNGVVFDVAAEDLDTFLAGECSKCKLRGGNNIAASPGERPVKRGKIWRWGGVGGRGSGFLGVLWW